MRDLQTIATACELEHERVREQRIAVWTSGAKVDHVCDGIDLKPLTFQVAIDLIYAGNPLLAGGDFTLQACILYLWRTATQYDPQSTTALADFIRACKTLEPEKIAELCQTHVQAAFFDPPWKGGSSSSNLEPVEPIVATVEELADRYGQSPDQVLEWPIARGYALQRAAYTRTIPQYSAPIPQTLFDLRNLYAAELTRQLSAIGEEGDHGQ